MIGRTKSVAVAGSGGIQIHDLERTVEYSSKSSMSGAGHHHGSPRSRKHRGEDHVSKIEMREPGDEVTRCLNIFTPNSNGAHLLCAAT